MDQPHDEYKSQLALGSGLELDFRDSLIYNFDRNLGNLVIAKPTCSPGCARSRNPLSSRR